MISAKCRLRDFSWIDPESICEDQVPRIFVLHNIFIVLPNGQIFHHFKIEVPENLFSGFAGASNGLPSHFWSPILTNRFSRINAIRLESL